MSKKWCQTLIDKVNTSYSDRILINDYDHLSQLEEIKASLNDKFFFHIYKNEFQLRSFLTESQEKPIVVFKTKPSDYIPYDIENSSHIITWQLQDIFPKIHITTLRKYPSGCYQKIYENYKSIENSLTFANEDYTAQLINGWLKEDLKENELQGLIEDIRKLLEDNNLDWRTIVPVWGRISFLKDLKEKGQLNNVSQINEIDYEINGRFEQYIFEHYYELFYEGCINGPVTIDKSLQYILGRPGRKKAIICFDGMGFQEWYCLKQFLAERGIIDLKEMAVYALLPTLTKTSRRALFSGLRSINDLNNTNEDKGFQKFLAENGNYDASTKMKVFINAGTKWNVEYLEYEALGIIINLMDDLAHSAKYVNNSKKAVNHNLILLLKDTEIDKIILELKSKGYLVFITSDHGSIWCQGNGYVPEKYLLEDRAKRALLYPNKILAQEYVKDKDLMIYQNSALLGENILVFPKAREMFGRKQESSITHGGIHIEEVIIPFVEVMQ